MIEAVDLTRRFAGITAVDGVSFAARHGEILGVLGPNGAGKTTTLRMLCGFLAPSSGTARVDGIDVLADSLAARRRIGYLPENNPLYPEMRVDEYLRFRAGLKGVPRGRVASVLDGVVARCGLADVVRQTIGTLSKGYRQRVGLADAIAGDPPVIVLDEPTSGLDPNQVQDVRTLVRSLREAHTVLFSSHQLHEVEQVCDRVVIFRQGRVIAQDTTDNLRAQSARGATVTLEVRAEDAARVPALVDGLAREVAREALDDGFLRLTLAPSADADPRLALFGRAAAAGIALRELTRRRLSLEEVFQELTTAPSGRAPRPAVAEDDA